MQRFMKRLRTSEISIVIRHLLVFSTSFNKWFSKSSHLCWICKEFVRSFKPTVNKILRRIIRRIMKLVMFYSVIQNVETSFFNYRTFKRKKTYILISRIPLHYLTNPRDASFSPNCTCFSFHFVMFVRVFLSL